MLIADVASLSQVCGSVATAAGSISKVLLAFYIDQRRCFGSPEQRLLAAAPHIISTCRNERMSLRVVPQRQQRSRDNKVVAQLQLLTPGRSESRGRTESSLHSLKLKMAKQTMSCPMICCLAVKRKQIGTQQLLFWLEWIPSRCPGANGVVSCTFGHFTHCYDSRSRRAIKEEWKKNKPAPEKQVSRTTLASQQLAAREKAERNLTGKSAAPVEEDEDEEMASDDLAFGSGASDDDLSVMSDASLSGDEDLGSDFDSEEDWSDSEFDDLEDDQVQPNGVDDDSGEDSDEAAERAYAAFRRRQDAHDQAEEAKATAGKQKLPTKLPDGSIKYDEADAAPVASTSKKTVKLPARESDDEESDDASTEPARPQDPLGPRFGRAGIKNLLQLPNKAQRVGLAKSELATLSGDIMADPENSVSPYQTSDRYKTDQSF